MFPPPRRVTSSAKASSWVPRVSSDALPHFHTPVRHYSLALHTSQPVLQVQGSSRAGVFALSTTLFGNFLGQDRPPSPFFSEFDLRNQHRRRPEDKSAIDGREQTQG